MCSAAREGAVDAAVKRFLWGLPHGQLGSCLRRAPLITW